MRLDRERERNELDELFDFIEMEDYLSVEGIDYKVTPGTSGVQLNLRECPRCGGTSWKVYLNMDTGFGNCFHGACVDEPGFSKFTFIKNHLGVTNGETIRHIKQYVATVGWKPKRSITVETQNTREIKLPAHYPIPIHDEHNLKYLSQRHIPTEVSKYFGWLYCLSGGFEYIAPDGETRTQDYSKRVLVPVYDLEGNLVTFQGRDITDEAKRKYLFPPGLAGTGRYLYNGHNCVGMKKVVINEGAFDVAATKMALDTEVDLRDVGVIGTFGKHISDGEGQSQTSALLALKAAGLKEITMMWDSEPKTLDDACKAAKHLKSLGFKTFLAILPPGRDPNECEAHEVVSAFRSAMLCTSTNLTKLRIGILRGSPATI